MFAVSATRTNQGAKAIIAKRAAAERESKDKAQLEANRIEMERRDLERAKDDSFRGIVLSLYREVHIAGKLRPSIRGIVRSVIKGTCYTFDDIIGQSVSRDLVKLRHEAVIRVFGIRADLSMQRIGLEFGGRDHSTIYYCLQKHGIDNTPEGRRKALQHVVRAENINAPIEDATIARLKDGRGK